jgi:hypothetical protein
MRPGFLLAASVAVAVAAAFLSSPEARRTFFALFWGWVSGAVAAALAPEKARVFGDQVTLGPNLLAAPWPWLLRGGGRVFLP